MAGTGSDLPWCGAHRHRPPAFVADYNERAARVHEERRLVDRRGRDGTVVILRRLVLRAAPYHAVADMDGLSRGGRVRLRRRQHLVRLRRPQLNDWPSRAGPLAEVVAAWPLVSAMPDGVHGHSMTEELSRSQWAVAGDVAGAPAPARALLAHSGGRSRKRSANAMKRVDVGEVRGEPQRDAHRVGHLAGRVRDESLALAEA